MWLAVEKRDAAVSTKKTVAERQGGFYEERVNTDKYKLSQAYTIMS